MANELYCFENGCKYDRKDKKGNKQLHMVRCTLCYQWFHFECVGLKNDSLPTAWPCLECRLMPSHLKTLQFSVSALMKTVDDLRVALEKSNELSSSMSVKCDRLLAENDDLKKSISDLRNVAPGEVREDRDSDSDDEEDDAEPNGALLIGDSIIRSIESSADDLRVTNLSGAKISDIKQTLKAIDTKKEKYEDIYIVCGTNDSVTKKTPEKIAQEFRSLLKVAKEKSQTVHVASVVPRADDKADMAKINTINRLLVTITDETTNVNLINNDRNFKYLDGSADESLLCVDKLHLSLNGTKKLLQNLQLGERAKARFGDGTSNWWHKKEHQKASDAPPPPPPPIQPSPVPRQPVSHRFEPQTNENSRQLLFRGSRSSFSNFHHSTLSMWGMKFMTNEHAYNYRKAIEMNQHATAEEIRRAPTPRESQLIGRNISTDDRWKGLKQSIMYELLQEKARQCETFRNDLIASQGQLLIEDTWHEFWGRGKHGSSLNVLGRLLMTLRDTLVKTHSPSQQAQRHQNSGRPYPNRNDQQPRCFNCGEKSHNVRTCRHASPIQCYACLENGHKKKFCSKQRRY